MLVGQVLDVCTKCEHDHCKSKFQWGWLWLMSPVHILMVTTSHTIFQKFYDVLSRDDRQQGGVQSQQQYICHCIPHHIREHGKVADTSWLNPISHAMGTIYQWRRAIHSYILYELCHFLSGSQIGPVLCPCRNKGWTVHAKLRFLVWAREVSGLRIQWGFNSQLG